MQYQRCLCLILAGIGWLDGSVAANAQHPDPRPRRPYVLIPFEGDLEPPLADQLLRAQGLEELKSILDQVQKNPGMSKLLRQRLGNLDRDRPGLLAEVQKLLEEPPRDWHIDPNHKQAIRSALEKKEGQAGAGPAKSKNSAFSPPPAKQPLPGKLPPPAGEAFPPTAEPTAGDDLLARWTRDLLREAEHWELGAPVPDSPALREGLRDLQLLIAGGEEARRRFPSGDLARWTEGLGATNWRNITLPDLSWAKSHSLSFPYLPRLKPRLPRVETWGGVPHLAPGLPRLGTPSANGRAFGQGFLWSAALGLAVLVFWQAMRQWSGMRARRAGANWQPGPWPVNPAHVATRAELIQAFEYLSLLRLGPEARSWNHRAIAANLGGQDGEDDRCRLAATELASVYERARYAPASDPLPADALASARRDLCLLARVASA